MNRFTELILKNGVRLKNRVVVPPMASQTADSSGFVTEKTLQHYQRLAEAQPGLLIVEYSYVHLGGRSEVNQLAVTPAHIAGLRQLATLIKKSGAVAGVQLVHGGAKSDRSLTGGRLLAPSAIAVPVKDRQLEVPEAMTLAEIQIWKDAFLNAATTAVEAGFQLIELHSAHGYGLNQWLSPLTNQRSDDYGKNRQKLLLNIVESIRIKFPQLLVSVRMPGQDFLDNGLQLNDTIATAQALEQKAVDFLHISSGIGGWRRPGTRDGEGYLVEEARQIQAMVKIPVIGVGGIQTGSYIDQAIASRHFSLAAVGRAILSDPQTWYQNNLKRKENSTKVTNFYATFDLWQIELKF